MAHALWRVSYATCDSAFNLVAFLAREPANPTNDQYCHVFRLQTPSQAQELNRIIGDAFQLAYAHQRLTKLQKENPHEMSAEIVLPKLVDRYQSNQIDSSLDLETPAKKNPSVLTVIDLPPPPDCPPPPINYTDNAPDNCSNQSNSSSVQMSHSIPSQNWPKTSAQAQCDPNFSQFSSPNSNSISSSGKPFSSTNVQKPNSTTTKLVVTDKRTRRSSSPQPPQPSVNPFSRRHFLRQSEGAKRSLFASSRPQSRGRSSGAVSAITNLFSFRHSIALTASSPAPSDQSPSSTTTRSSATTTTVLDWSSWLELDSPESCSPVVALKERLDAEALAQLKASAASETEAVLRAARAAASSVGSLLPTHEHQRQYRVRRDEQRQSRLMELGEDNEQELVASDPTQFNDQKQQQHFDSVNDEEDPPPVPPERINSLRRPSAFNNNNQPSSSPQVTTLDRRRLPVRPVRASNGHQTNGGTGGHQDARSPRWHQQQRNSVVAAVSSGNDDSPNSAFVRSSSEHTFLQSDDHSNMSQRPAIATGTSSGPATSTCSNQHHHQTETPSNVVGDCWHNDMSTSSLSTETPTPLATPNQTPTNAMLASRRTSSPTAIDLVCNGTYQSPWYQDLLPRDLAFELLAQEEVGTFLVRKSITQPNCCALSVKVENPSTVTHYLIQPTDQGGVALKGLDKEWPSMQALITHLTVIPEMLPCPLRFPVQNTNPSFKSFNSSSSSGGRVSSSCAAVTTIQQHSNNNGDNATNGQLHRSSHRLAGRPFSLVAMAVDHDNDQGQLGCQSSNKLKQQQASKSLPRAPVVSVIDSGDGDNGSIDLSDDYQQELMDDVDPDYQRLSDFSSMMAELEQTRLVE